MRSLRRGVDLMVDLLCAAVMLAIVALTLFQVSNRFILQYPIGWTDEGARFLAVWVGLLGAARCVREDSHIQIDLFFRMLGAEAQRWLAAAGVLLFVVLVLIVLWQSTEIVPLVARQTAAASRISMAWVYAAAPVSGVLMLYYLLERLVRILHRRGRPADGVGEGTDIA